MCCQCVRVSVSKEVFGVGGGGEADWYCVTEMNHTASPHMLPAHHTDAALFVIVIFDK